MPDRIVLTNHVSKQHSAVPHRLVPISPDRELHPGSSDLGVFIGRNAELESLTSLLVHDNVRLLTLTGPGGVGKTRLSRELCHSIAPLFNDGVRFCHLAPIQESDAVIHALAETIGLHNPAGPDAKQRMIGWLQSRTILIVMDNFEHVIEASPDVVNILRDCPNVSILVTSRIPLDVYGERIFDLKPLDFPDRDDLAESTKLKESDAVRLLLDRGSAANLNILEEPQAHVIAAEICEHLDGLPLAIELAAARLNVLSLSGLRDHLEIGLPLLSTSARDVPDRLRTMHNAIAWSYNLLGAPDQESFQQLTIFAAGFDLDSARAVLDSAAVEIDAIETISRLRKSSLITSELAADGNLRFGMLQTIREFGYEMLRDSGKLHQAENSYLSWAADFAERTSRDLVGENQRAGLRKLDLERSNIQHALNLAMQRGDHVSGIRICSALWLYWNTRGLINEGISWIEQLLDTSIPIPDAVLASAVFTRGILYSHLGDIPTSLQAANDSLEIAERIDSPVHIALALYLRGLVENRLQHWEAAEHDIEWAISYMLAAGEETAEPALLNDLGRTAYLRRDFAKAQQRFSTALKLARKYRLPRSQSMILHNLANLAADQQDYARAAELNIECMEINLNNGDDWHIMLPIISLVRIAKLAGNITLAAHLTGHAESLVNQPGVTLWDWKLPDDYQDIWETTHQILENRQLQTELAKGRMMSPEEAIAAARDLYNTQADVSLAELLTPRELDVAHLLLNGSSDLEIGEALYISRRTAQTHLGSVYRKLGVHSRPEAIRALSRMGDIDKFT